MKCVMETAIMGAPAQSQVMTGGAAFTVPVVGNPFTYTNDTGVLLLAIINGGVVNIVSSSRDGVTFDVLGLLNGVTILSPGDKLRITYTITPPTLKMYPL